MSMVAEPLPKTPPASTVHTPEELLALPDGERFELVDGQLVEREMGLLSSVVGTEILAHLRNFVREHRLGWTPNSECGYQCFPWAPKQVRRPDASFISGERLSADHLDVGFVPIAPDLAVEVASTNDLFSEVVAKADEYLRAGVRLVWLIAPPTRRVYVHRSDGTAAFLGEEDTLEGEEVLPGFRLPVRELFPS